MGQGRNITLAPHAGFCFGVDRAMKLVNGALDNYDNVYSLGQVVHNNIVNEDLKNRGLNFIENPEDVPDGAHVLLRAHGVTPETYEYFEKRGIGITDLTCPFVKKTQRILSGFNPETDVVFITGVPGHAETISLLGFSKCKTFLVTSADEIERIIKENPELFKEKEVKLVSQTTFSLKEWEKCVEKVNFLCTNRTIFDTICKATEERQKEAEVLSKRSDRMIVVGSKHSSNTNKLVGVCRNNVETCLVESAKDLKPEFLDGAKNICVTAGASTPSATIKEVLEAMSEVENKQIIDDSEDFAALLKANLDSVEETSNNQCQEGTVVGINPTEIQVEFDGKKQTGLIKYPDEFSGDPNISANPEDVVKIGDKINCFIMKTNDVEGTIMCSKRRFEAQNAWNELEEALEEEAVIDGTVTDINKGGVIATTKKGIRVFIPGSLATENRGQSLEDLRGEQVRFRVVEVNRGRKRAVGSIKAVVKEERKEARDKFWETAEVGQKFEGVVKSLTSYGAFVDIGGVDGMIHISELSWKRIKHPSEVLEVGQKVEVYIKSLDNNRISLGYKKDEDNPWVVLKNTYEVGDVVDAKIVGMTTFGAFANIIPGIDGLIHISQIANRRIEKPQDVLEVGQEVKAIITEIDYDKKRVSLSIRALLEEEAIEEVEEENAEDELAYSSEESVEE